MAEILRKIEQLEKELGEVNREIVLQNGHKFTSDFGAFILKGAAYCRALIIQRGPNDTAFAGQPPDFFDNLIKHFHETENPDEVVASLNIALALNNPASWPASLILLLGADLGLISKEQLEKDGVPTLAEEKVFHDERKVVYSMRNKNKPMVEFKLWIHFEGGAKCYQSMTGFTAKRIDVYNYCKCIRYILRNKHNPGIAFKLWIYFEGDAQCFQQMTEFNMRRVEDVQSGEA